MKSTYLLVGASSGIGLATAIQLSKEGHRVIAFSREARDLSKYPAIEHHVVDVTAETPSFPTLDVSVIDGFVYFPGSINLRPFRSLKPATFQASFEVNVLGLVKSLQQYLSLLKKSGQASVVLFSTVAVQTGMPFHASVAASKGAIEGIGRSLAAELAPKIRVNVVAPSMVNTPLASRFLSSESKLASSNERHPMKRIGEVEDIANMVCFLLSEKSSWMTGQVLGMDGGLGSLKT